MSESSYRHIQLYLFIIFFGHLQGLYNLRIMRQRKNEHSNKAQADGLIKKLKHKLLEKINSYDAFAQGPSPFNLGGKSKATTTAGGLVSLVMKFVTATFFLYKLNDMVFFEYPTVFQISIQGTPTELTTVYGEEKLGNTSLAIQIKQPESDGDPDQVAALKQDLEKLLRYMEVHQSSSSKLGSKKTPYKDTIVWNNLTSMIQQNSHDFPEVKLDPRDIYFSGSEDSPEKMKIISTKFDLRFNNDLLFKDAYEACMANQTCKDVVPSLIDIANDMQDEFVDTNGLSRVEISQRQNEWMDRVLFDQNYTDLYRLIFKNYMETIQANQA